VTFSFTDPDGVPAHGVIVRGGRDLHSAPPRLMETEDTGTAEREQPTGTTNGTTGQREKFWQRRTSRCLFPFRSIDFEPELRLEALVPRVVVSRVVVSRVLVSRVVVSRVLVFEQSPPLWCPVPLFPFV